MDLLTAVAVSMLPLSRLKVAAVTKELVQSAGRASLDGVLELAGRFDGPGGLPGVKSLALERAESALAAGEALGLSVISLTDPRYPALLRCTPDPPPVLWIRGEIGALTPPPVAVVGSRAASPYALQVGRRLAAELAERGIVVVSGLARGTDSAAHEGCLSAAGQTIAVIGSGLDNVYPPEHEALADRIAEKGLVISELGPGAAPRAEHFPLRNRIISGISLAVVVVEASEKSGSLITAACAVRQGRDVMAVPGSILNGRNGGSHALLKDGAKVVETADDILEDIGWGGGAGGPERRRRPNMLPTDPVLTAMDPGEVYRLDALVEATGIPAARLLPRLMQLELIGRIESPGSGCFMRPA